MHQYFTEPLTPASESAQIKAIDELSSTLQNWLNEARRKYNKIKNRNISEAQFELMWKYGEYLAVQNPRQWRKFYRENVGKRCDYEKLKRLFYKFYKIKLKEQRLANVRNGWYNI